MTTGAEVVAEARACVGTPFVHQGRLPGVGVDCAGVVICVARRLGLTDYDFRGYRPQPDGHTLAAQCAGQMRALGAGEPARAGDVALLRFLQLPQHLAIVSEVDAAGQPARIVHAYQPLGRCVEHVVDARWRRRILRLYRLPGVE